MDWQEIRPREYLQMSDYVSILARRWPEPVSSLQKRRCFGCIQRRGMEMLHQRSTFGYHSSPPTTLLRFVLVCLFVCLLCRAFSQVQRSLSRLGWLARKLQWSACVCLPGVGIASTHLNTWVSFTWILGVEFISSYLQRKHFSSFSHLATPAWTS